MSAPIQILQDRLFDDHRKIIFKSLEERYNKAADFWWHHRGHISTVRICKSLVLNNDHLTKLIQQQMRVNFQVDIPNHTPTVEIINTKEQIDQKYPNQSTHYVERGHTLELFYYLAHPNLIQQTNGTTQQNLRI